MFEYIQGNLTIKGAGYVVVDIHGLGYRIYIPSNEEMHALQLQTQVMLYISSVIREDSYRHFGFLSTQQRDLFEQLCTVSKIGPKIALAIFSAAPFAQIIREMIDENSEFFSKIPGIGKKTSERLVIEMRGKVVAFGDSSKKISNRATNDGALQSTLSALIRLGYSEKEGLEAIQQVAHDGVNDVASLLQKILMQRHT